VSDGIREDPIDDVPPVFPSWNHWYALVLGVLIVLMIVFYLFTKMFE
jgi:hypothetical protein